MGREQAARVLDRYELAHASEQKFESLSGGQQARFQILLLELSGATLLLLDEPTDNLDVQSAEALEDGLEAFEGTVIAVTHDRWFARGFDRFLVYGADGDVYESDGRSGTRAGDEDTMSELLITARSARSTTPSSTSSTRCSTPPRTFGGREATGRRELDELRATAEGGHPAQVPAGIRGRAGGRIVAAACVEGSLLDNLDLGYLQVNVHPDHRRLGYGSEVLARCEEVAKQRGRSTVLANVATGDSTVGLPTATATRGVEFGRHHGYAMAPSRSSAGSRSRSRRRPWTGPAASAAEKHAGYTLRSWSGPVPRGAALGLGRGHVCADDRGAHRRHRARARDPRPRPSARRRPWPSSRAATLYATAPLDASGAVVAYTNFGATPRAHRAPTSGGPSPARTPRPPARHGGQGRESRQLRARRPDLGQVVTWNAEVNSHMIGVNEEMGFVPVERWARCRRMLDRASARRSSISSGSATQAIAAYFACPAMERWLLSRDTSASTGTNSRSTPARRWRSRGGWSHARSRVSR